MVNRQLKTLREKIGSLICPRVFGDRQGWDCFDFPDAQQFIEEYPPAFFIVFGGEAQSTPKLFQWINAELLPRPAVYCADLEEGAGQQIRGATRFPPMMALGATQDEELARSLGYAIAEEAGSLGIRWLLGPVLDLARDPRNPVMGNRCLGSDPEKVSALTCAFLEGVHAAKGISTAKHFPGHGSTSTDSHESLAKLDFPLKWLERFDLKPFQAALKSQVRSVMVGHLALPCLEPDERRPASLSSKVIEGYLRGKMGYNGVVLTDALIMGAVKSGGDPDSLALEALQAGNDLLLMPADPLASARKIFEAVEKGFVSEKRIDRSLDRLSRMQRTESAKVSSLSRPQLDLRVAHQSLTLLGRREGFITLRENEPVSLTVWVESKNGEEQAELLRRELPRRGFPIHEKGRPVLAVFSDNRAWRGRAGLSEETTKKIKTALKDQKNPVLLAFSSPFAITPFVDDCAVLLSYGACPSTVQASVAALGGEFSPQGVLPVSLS